MGSLIEPNVCWPSRPFPPEDKCSWEKHHDRLERRRLARVCVSPEEAGLVGCWQFIAVERERIPLDDSKPKSREVQYYATSLTAEQYAEKELSELIRDHWSAIENGVHYRRDVSFGEDQCRVRNRTGAEALATLRNLAIAVYELEVNRGKTNAQSLRTWMKGLTFSETHRALMR